jgi:hypothetical protein
LHPANTDLIVTVREGPIVRSMEAVSPFNELLVQAELQALEREERELSALRRRLHDQIDAGFANDLTRGQERSASRDRRTLHSQIDALRDQLRRR